MLCSAVQRHCFPFPKPPWSLDPGGITAATAVVGGKLLFFIHIYTYV
jgi:hypothetical protein